MPGVHGLHHVTAIAGAAQENLDFYAGVLGMRLVKKTVNQDDPGTYHLFFADADGAPGTDLTFFPWPHLAPPAGATASRTRWAWRSPRARWPPGARGWSVASTIEHRLRPLVQPGRAPRG